MKKYRVKKAPNIWIDDEFFYPEEKWLGLWWRMDDGNNNQVFFKTEENAWEFINKLSTSRP